MIGKKDRLWHHNDTLNNSSTMPPISAKLELVNVTMKPSTQASTTTTTPATTTTTTTSASTSSSSPPLTIRPSRIPVKKPVIFSSVEIREEPDAVLNTTVEPTTQVVVLAKEKELDEHQDLGGVILPTDEHAADPSLPPVAISPDAVNGLKEIVHSDALPTIATSTLTPQPVIATEKPEAGFWKSVFGGVFGGTQKVKRDVVSTNGNASGFNDRMAVNQTFSGYYRCEKACVSNG